MLRLIGKDSCSLSVRELFSVLEVLEIVFVSMLSQMLLQLILLLHKVGCDFVINSFEELLNGWLLEVTGCFQSISHSGSSLIPELLRVSLLDHAFLEKIGFKSLNGTFQFGKEVLPLLHLLVVPVPL